MTLLYVIVSLDMNKCLIIGLCCMFLLCIADLIYRSIILLRRDKLIPNEVEEGISVIITSYNCASLLRKNLAGFLMQDYKNYEVIVVDECSEDDTQDVLAIYQKDYPHLKVTRIPPGTKFRYTKKLAINIGILSAKYDRLLFSEPNCYPVSSLWLKNMSSYFSSEIAVVVGYSNYPIDLKGWSNTIKRYFLFLSFLDNILLVKRDKYLWGNGCNMGYRKTDYITSRGFAGNSQTYLGYDNDMVKMLSQFGKVKVAKDSKTFMKLDKYSNGKRVSEMTYHYASKAKWPLRLRLESDIKKIIRFIFYLFSICLLIAGVEPLFVLSLMVGLYLLDLIMMNIYVKHFQHSGMFRGVLVMGLIGFVYRWCWSIYSLFSRKRWR